MKVGSPQLSSPQRKNRQRQANNTDALIPPHDKYKNVSEQVDTDPLNLEIVSQVIAQCDKALSMEQGKTMRGEASNNAPKVQNNMGDTKKENQFNISKQVRFSLLKFIIGDIIL